MQQIPYNHRLHATCGCVAKIQLQVVRRKPQATSAEAQAQGASHKRRGASYNLRLHTTCGCITETQAASSKPQAPRRKPQGASPLHQGP